MTNTLYYSPNTASLVVHWLLIELDVPHALHLVDIETQAQKSPEYLKLNPQGRVPTLVLNGQVLTESAAIAMHVADLYPQANLAPEVGTPARAAYYRWMFFCAYTLMPAYRGWFYPDEPAGADNIARVMASSQQSLEQAWQQVAEHLQADGPYLLGGQLSAADFVLTMMMRWSRNMPRPTDDWPVLKVFADRMKARRAFKETCRREGITDWL